MKTIKMKKMERLSGSHPVSLPHSGELFLIGSSRRKRKTFVVSAGAGQGSQAKDYAITQGWGFFGEPAVSQLLGIREVSG